MQGYPDDPFYPPGTYKIEIQGKARNAANPEKMESIFFYLELKDICNPPTSITAPESLPNHSYTVTTDYADFGPGDWQIVPSFCPFDYEVTIGPMSTNDPDTAVSFNDDTD